MTVKIICTGADKCGNSECRHAQLHWPHGNVCAYKTDCMGIKDVYCEEPQKIKKMTADHVPDAGEKEE